MGPPARSEDVTGAELAAILEELERARAVPLVDYFCIHPSDWDATRLSMNDRFHFRTNADRTKFWKELATILARRLRTKLARGRVEIIYRFPDDQRREVSNLQSTSKAIVDGLVEAGIYPDDSDKYLIGPDNRRDPFNGPHRLTILIYGVPIS